MSFVIRAFLFDNGKYFSLDFHVTELNLNTARRPVEAYLKENHPHAEIKQLLIISDLHTDKFTCELLD